MIQKKIVVTAALLFLTIKPLPQPLFYEPTWFIKPPRFERDWLFTANAMFRGGIANEGYNCQHQKVNTLDIYGVENIRDLAQGVPTNQLGPNSFLNTLYLQTPANKCFGTINWQGRFSVLDFVLQATQNFRKGFYIQVVAPWRRLKTSNITYNDNSTSNGAGTIDYQSWLQLFNNLPEVLCEYGIDIYNNKNHGFGNIQLLFGWTENNQSFDYIDYWDYSITTGVFFKNSSCLSPAQPFLFSTGYEHHLSIPLSVNTAFGVYDWLTIGAHATGYFFKNNRQLYGIKSAADQNGWLKLAREVVDVDKGNIYEIGGYISADHVLQGFSSTLGFSYAHEDPTRLHVVTNPTLYNQAIVNSDARLQSWSMVNLHWFFEWDLASHTKPHLPQLSLSVDVPISGTRSLRTKMIGSSIQCNATW